MPRLPVTGLAVHLRPPTGEDDVFLCEAEHDLASLALGLLDRVAVEGNGADVDWATLPITDLDALLIALRQIVFGDLISTDMPCPITRCGARMDVSFRLSDYLAHHTPRQSRAIEPADESGWYRLIDAPVSFRLPNGEDQLAVRYSPQPARALAQRCIRPPDVAAGLRRRVEHALAAMAPSLSHQLDAQCPECGSPAAFYFDVRHFVLAELRANAAYVFEDTHLIARSYHWPEEEALSLPSSRRQRYAELIRADRTGIRA